MSSTNPQHQHRVVVNNNKIKLSATKKWMLAIIAALLFALLGSPISYPFSNKLLSKVKMSTCKEGEGGPSWVGFGVHFVLFFLIFRIVLIFLA